MKRHPPTPSGEMEARGTPPLDPLIQAAHKSHGLDLSPFDETFLAKALQGRLTATSAGTWALYLDRLAGDTGRLRQVLTNLAGNAVKFTDRGEVALRVSRAKDNHHAQEASCLLRFSVRDTGIGIPADKIGILFQEFTQVDGSTTRKFGGAGLGLALGKQFAEMLGGEIGVESVEGQGSEFWFTARFGLQTETARETQQGDNP